jgi:hypothetical protein
MSTIQVLKAKSLVLTPGGESSKHLLVCEKNIEYNTVGDDQTIHFEIMDTAVIKHTEHGHMHLEPGRYVKTNQVEFNPFTNTVSYVFD